MTPRRPERIIKAMADRIIYRGPDGEGYYVDDQVALGHRRLSIIDLEGGKQPMFNEDGSLVVIFNGEIYNFQTLRQELINAGHTFTHSAATPRCCSTATRSGATVCLPGCGACSPLCSGDTKTRTMFGARDIFGIKPFYYYNVDGLFLFGSEIKSFLAHPASARSSRGAPARVSERGVYPQRGDHVQKRLQAARRPLCSPGKPVNWMLQRYYDIRYHVDESPR